MRYRLGFIAALSVASAGLSSADTMLWQIPNEAQAVITTSTNLIEIQVTDLYVNPTDVSDNVSGIFITLSGNLPTSESIRSASADEIQVGKGGAITDNGTVTPGWTLSLNSAVTSLDDLASGATGPAETLLGSPASSGKYSGANSSIVSNGPHNPFLDGVVTWFLNAPGVTSATSVSAVVFQFGTSSSDRQSATDPPLTTPEPGSWLLLGAGIAALVILRKRFGISAR